MDAGLTLDALEQALWARKVDGTLVHHSDRGSQYLSMLDVHQERQEKRATQFNPPLVEKARSLMVAYPTFGHRRTGSLGCSH